MATSITHTVLAKKIYDKLHLTIDENEFMVGNIFPDIRYLGVIDRNETHLENSDLNKIKGENAFKAGMLTHSLVDEIVGDFAKINIYPLCDNHELNSIAIKLLSDELLYGKISDWNKYIKAFDKIYPTELEFGIEPEIIKRYHIIARKYLSQNSNDKSRRAMLSGCNFSDEKITKINTRISEIRKNPQIVKAINKMYNDFELSE